MARWFLFRGKDAIHRVTPTIGDRTRILSVLAYNSRPDVKSFRVSKNDFFWKALLIYEKKYSRIKTLRLS